MVLGVKHLCTPRVKRCVLLTRCHVYLNARSIKSVTKTCNKLTDLHNMVFENDKHIIAITETWLNDTVNDGEIIPMNYTAYRKNREQTCPGQ